MLCIRRSYVRLAAVELFARNGTRPELLLRKMDSFQNSPFYWGRKESENFEFFQNSKLRQLKNRLCHIRYGDGSQKVTAKVTQKVTAKLSNNQNKILEEIKKNPFITQSELSELVGME